MDHVTCHTGVGVNPSHVVRPSLSEHIKIKQDHNSYFIKIYILINQKFRVHKYIKNIQFSHFIMPKWNATKSSSVNLRVCGIIAIIGWGGEETRTGTR